MSIIGNEIRSGAKTLVTGLMWIFIIVLGIAAFGIQTLDDVFNTVTTSSSYDNVSKRFEGFSFNTSAFPINGVKYQKCNDMSCVEVQFKYRHKDKNEVIIDSTFDMDLPFGINYGQALSPVQYRVDNGPWIDVEISYGGGSGRPNKLHIKKGSNITDKLLTAKTLEFKVPNWNAQEWYPKWQYDEEISRTLGRKIDVRPDLEFRVVDADGKPVSRDNEWAEFRITIKSEHIISVNLDGYKAAYNGYTGNTQVSENAKQSRDTLEAKQMIREAEQRKARNNFN